MIPSCCYHVCVLVKTAPCALACCLPLLLLIQQKLVQLGLCHALPMLRFMLLLQFGQPALSPRQPPPAGFEAAPQQLSPRKERPLPEHLQPLLEECRPLYALLRRHALRPLRPAVPRPLGHAGAAEQQQAGQLGQQGGQQAESGSSLDATEPQAMQCGSLAYLEDTRNDDVLVGMRDGVTGAAALALLMFQESPATSYFHCRPRRAGVAARG